ncbi:hypothetical protein [Bradyrhizobium japonicum]|uniref:hypothetical protein n=1 Tax=Bradyrhizobium japonicum TaxID=375 RepID=UPI001B8A7DD7|nr:hypothetical protein [Bradyrhizobium japonicum]MBR0973664.1 hypothetical protein [Bradyrhizobium japonicum]
MNDRSKLDAFISEIEAAAYQRGVDDTWAKVRERAEKLQREMAQFLLQHDEDAITDEPEGAEESAHDPDFFDGSSEPREGSDQAKVLGVIRLQPGLRGTDIVKALGGNVHERTVRTSLHRLKRRGAIMKAGETWIPVQTGK